LMVLILLSPICLNAETFYVQNFESNEKGILGGEELNGQTIEISTTQASTGIYSLKIGMDRADAYVNARVTFEQGDNMGDEWYARVRFFVDSTVTSTMGDGENWQILAGENSEWSGEWALEIKKNASGNFLSIAWDSTDTSEYADSTEGVWNNEAWNTVEIHFIRSETVGAVTVWCNGVQVINETGKDTGAKNTMSFYFCYYGTSDFTGNIYFDDLVIDSSNYIGTGYRIQEGVAVGSCPYF